MDKPWGYCEQPTPEPLASDNFDQSNDTFFDALSFNLPLDSPSNFDEAFAAPDIPSTCLNYSIDPKATVLHDDSMSLAHEKPHTQSQHSSDSPTPSWDSSMSPRGHKRKGSSNSDGSTASDQGRPMLDAVSYQDVDVDEKNLISDFGARDSAVALNPPFNTLTLDADISAEQTMSKSFDFESASSSPSGLSRSTPMMQTVTEQRNVVVSTVNTDICLYPSSLRNVCANFIHSLLHYVHADFSLVLVNLHQHVCPCNRNLML